MDPNFSESSEDVGFEENSHLFGRQKPVHSALCAADVILWRNKQISAALLVGCTVLWLLFERIGYRLVPFISHSLILSFSTLFLWSNISSFVNKSPIIFPEISLPEDVCTKMTLTLIHRCNNAIHFMWGVASGKDIKQFASAIMALWFVSAVGSWFDFLTIVYSIFVVTLTMPSLYEKHEDQVDNYAQKAKANLKRQYSQLDEKVLQKLPKVPFMTDNKQH